MVGHRNEERKGLYTAIGETIADPDSIYKSSQEEHPDRNVYFKRCTSATYSPALTTKVVCQAYNDGRVGFVVTTNPQRDERGGIGECIYKRS